MRAAASAGPPAVASRTSRSVNASQPTSRVWALPDEAHQSIRSAWRRLTSPAGSNEPA
jgi:hypothetical protein